jgi:hypothetical protein
MSEKKQWILLAVIALLSGTTAAMWLWPWFVKWCIIQ